MVDPATMGAVMQAAGAASKLAGGIFGAARAKARGEYLATQAEEQRKLYARQFNRKMEQELGQAAQTGGRGIEVSGSVISGIYSEAFDLILQREAVKQRLSQQASQARTTGSIQGLAALGAGFGAALDTTIEGVQEYNKSKSQAQPKAQPKTEGDTE